MLTIRFALRRMLPTASAGNGFISRHWRKLTFLPCASSTLMRVEDRALGGAPRDDREVGVLRPMQRVLLVLRDRLLRQRELAHALVHHRHAHLDALGDVAVGVVLVGRDPEAAARQFRAGCAGEMPSFVSA